jgi:hypothetical protein
MHGAGTIAFGIDRSGIGFDRVGLRQGELRIAN